MLDTSGSADRPPNNCDRLEPNTTVGGTALALQYHSHPPRGNVHFGTSRAEAENAAVILSARSFLSIPSSGSNFASLSMDAKRHIISSLLH